MSSSRKLEIQNDLPKITKINWFCYLSCVNNNSTIQLNFKNSENIFLKDTPLEGIKPQSLGVEATDHRRNRLAKENYRKRL